MAGMHHGDAGPKAADSASNAQGASASGCANGVAALSASGSDTNDFHNRLLVEVGNVFGQHALACAPHGGHLHSQSSRVRPAELSGLAAKWSYQMFAAEWTATAAAASCCVWLGPPYPQLHSDRAGYYLCSY